MLSLEDFKKLDIWFLSERKRVREVNGHIAAVVAIMWSVLIRYGKEDVLMRV